MAGVDQFEHEKWEPPDKELRALRKDFFGPLTDEVGWGKGGQGIHTTPRFSSKLFPVAWARAFFRRC